MTYDDLRNHFYLLTKTSSSDISAPQLTALVKKAQARVSSLALTASGRWEIDDSNRTDLPIATTGIVANQQDYSIDTSFLKVRRVELQDAFNNWHRLTPYDNEDFKGLSITQQSIITGTPERYDLLGNSVILWPKPNYTLAAALKVYFERALLEFDYSTGQFPDGSGSVTSSPGFNSLYHSLLALWAAYDYAIANGQNVAVGIMAEIQRLEAALLGDYGRRDRDDRPRITMRKTPFI